MKRYNPKDIEPKWQKAWAESGIYQAKDFDSRSKYVMLTEFPYPSGAGMHIGHIREYTLGDLMSRHKRMQGYNVLFPMGYDAFGLPTENYAIKNKISPQKATEDNVATFQKQLESMGFSFDWSRSFKTSDPDYYKWTQWLFLQFFKAGLAYQAEIAINWCPFCKTGLANEEVVNGRHERCDTPVEKKLLKQWLLKITDYADRLIEGLKTVDYPSRIADQQINWIGRSKGAEIDFAIENSSKKIKVFTTRPDTIFGATFMVLAPEHPLVQKIVTPEQKQHVETYIKAAQAKSDVERQDTDREKTGVFTGAFAINPANNEKIPAWIADYVLTGYGTGAIMAVPAHDDRDWEFAQKFDLPIMSVIMPDQAKYLIIEKSISPTAAKKLEEFGSVSVESESPNWGKFWRVSVPAGKESEFRAFLEVELLESDSGGWYTDSMGTSNWVIFRGRSLQVNNQQDYEEFMRVGEEIGIPHEQLDIAQPAVWHDEGIMINSGKYDGMPSNGARDKIVEDLAKKGVATEKINYRLRDWIFSRQHYWGEPIPIIHCPDHGAVAVPDDQLPVELPKVDHYEPTDTGESPLAAITDWVNTTCPTCGKPAKRETDTMPNWAGSSWYYLRYFDAHNDKTFADRKKLDYWGNVDMYLGGMEHTTLHLLYSRFWHQFFYDQGLVPTPEPYQARRGQGIILAADGTKMSKSKGNVVNPTEIIEAGYGADALRVAIAFLAPYDQTTPWSPEGVAGTHRFLNRVWTLVQEFLSEPHKENSDSPELLRAVHSTIKKVSEDLESMAFNTAIAAQMQLVNDLFRIKAGEGYQAAGWQWALETLLQLLAPFAPHIAEELWHQLGHENSIHTNDWPKWDEKYLAQDTVTVVVQVNGKLRGEVQVAAAADEATVVAAAQANQKVASYLEGKEIRKTIYVPQKLVSFVVS